MDGKITIFRVPEVTGLPRDGSSAVVIPSALPAAVESTNRKAVLSCFPPELILFVPHQQQVFYLKGFKHAKLISNLCY